MANCRLSLNTGWLVMHSHYLSHVIAIKQNLCRFLHNRVIGASVSEPHTSLFNCDFSKYIICRTSFRISLMLSFSDSCGAHVDHK